MSPCDTVNHSGLLPLIQRSRPDVLGGGAVKAVDIVSGYGLLLLIHKGTR